MGATKNTTKYKCFLARRALSCSTMGPGAYLHDTTPCGQHGRKRVPHGRVAALIGSCPSRTTQTQSANKTISAQVHSQVYVFAYRLRCAGLKGRSAAICATSPPAP